MKTCKKLLIIFGAVIALTILLSVITSFNPFVFIMPEKNSMDKAVKQTRILIIKSEFIGNYEELGAWIADYHGAAPDQQIMIEIGHWATKNEDGFKTIIQLLETLGKTQKLDLLSFMLVQSGQEEKFLKKYKKDNSPHIQRIIKDIKRQRNQTSENI